MVLFQYRNKYLFMPRKPLSKPEPEKKEKVFNLRLPHDVHELLSKLAAEENRSLNNMVVELIKRAAKG